MVTEYSDMQYSNWNNLSPGNGLSNSLSVSGHSTMLLREGIEVCEREKRKKKKNKMKEIML